MYLGNSMISQIETNKKGKKASTAVRDKENKKVKH